MQRVALAAGVSAIGALLLGGAQAGAHGVLAPAEVSYWTAREGLILLGPLTCSDGRCAPAPRIAVTRDGGRHWRLLAVSPGAFTAVRGTRTAFALTPSGLLRTDDRARTWRRVSRPPRGIYFLTFATPLAGWALAPDPAASNGVNLPAKILATADGGRTWERVRSPCARSIWFTTAVALATPRSGWAICGAQPATGSRMKALYVTTDGGKTWMLRAGRTRFEQRPRGIGLSDYGGADGIAFQPSGVGWLWGSRADFVTTRDGGRSWRPLRASHPDVVFPWSVSFVSDRIGFAVIHDIRVGRRFAVTRDGGETWRNLRVWSSR